MRWLSMATALLLVLTRAAAAEEPIRIVTWNAEAIELDELGNRLPDFKKLADELEPDVLILIEMAGLEEVQSVAQALDWSEYYAAVSDWSQHQGLVFSRLEAAVISKIPIEAVVEHDASVDGFHEVFSHAGAVPGLVSEVKLSSNGIPGFGSPLAHTDRGTLRVDLSNGLTIFPLHLKSNRNGPCSDVGRAIETLEGFGIEVPEARRYFDDGFAQATDVRRTNALKRERVIAAVARVANRAIEQDGRTAVIAGDFNTTFETGLHGVAVDDCAIQDFSCAKAPFPASACTPGDGYDDTLGILKAGLVRGANSKIAWSVLSDGLGRTYDDACFADRAIDHIAVAAAEASRFSVAAEAGETFGSDHYPVCAEFASDGRSAAWTAACGSAVKPLDQSSECGIGGR